MGRRNMSGYAQTQWITVKWSPGPADMVKTLEAWKVAMRARLQRAMEDVARRIEDWAKANHPWTNRTGAAEAGLHATVTFLGDTCGITLAHGVFYGVYLELKWGGKWGVITTALTSHYGDVMAAMQAAISGA
jgi:hypothetical protein